MTAPDRPPQLLSLDEIGERLERVLAQSPADETEVVWLETFRGKARRQGSRVDVHAGPQRSILVRRTTCCGAGD